MPGPTPASGPRPSTWAPMICWRSLSTAPKFGASSPALHPARGTSRRPPPSSNQTSRILKLDMSSATDEFVNASQDRFLEELKSFLRIPSISTLPEHRGDIDSAARFVADSLGAAGLENVEIIATGKHPLGYADWMHAPGKPTVLCYGHYDVQPPDPLDQCVSLPFEPTIRDR